MSIVLKFIMFFALTVTTIRGAEAIRISCVGNSITEGNNNYPSYLQKLLGSGYVVGNYGSSGTTLLKKGDSPYWTKGKLSQALQSKPDIVTIKLGTNDTKSQNWDTHHNEFKTDYLAMIDTFIALPSQPKIFVVLPVPVFKTMYGIRDSVLKLEAVIIKDIAEERDLPLIDANTPLLPFGSHFSDGVHPDRVASDTIARVFYRALTAATGVHTPFLCGNIKQIVSSQGTTGVIMVNTFSRLPEGNLFDVAGRRQNGQNTHSAAGAFFIIPEPLQKTDGVR